MLALFTSVRSRALSTKPIRFPETMPETTVPIKPRIGQFRTAFFHSFLIASTTYMILHAIWYRMELENAQVAMEAKSALLEQRIQELVDEKKLRFDGQKRWYHKLKFWT